MCAFTAVVCFVALLTPLDGVSRVNSPNAAAMAPRKKRWIPLNYLDETLGCSALTEDSTPAIRRFSEPAIIPAIEAIEARRCFSDPTPSHTIASQAWSSGIAHEASSEILQSSGFEESKVSIHHATGTKSSWDLHLHSSPIAALIPSLVYSSPPGAQYSYQSDCLEEFNSSELSTPAYDRECVQSARAPQDCSPNRRLQNWLPKQSCQTTLSATRVDIYFSTREPSEHSKPAWTVMIWPACHTEWAMPGGQVASRTGLQRTQSCVGMVRNAGSCRKVCRLRGILLQERSFIPGTCHYNHDFGGSMTPNGPHNLSVAPQ